jgi:hypothetical protein
MKTEELNDCPTEEGAEYLRKIISELTNEIDTAYRELVAKTGYNGPPNLIDAINAMPFLNPGEGWRLLAPREPVTEGDERSEWTKSFNWADDGKQSKFACRRRTN